MNDGQKNTLKKWRSRYKRAQLSHSYSAVAYSSFSTYLGIFLIVLTTASAVLIFADLKDYYWISPTVGILAALFAYLQIFLRFSEKSELHRSTERKYGELKKDIEFLLAFSSSGEFSESKVEEIKRRESIISREAPHSLSCCWDRAKRETENENEKYSIRNFPT